jgi:hypothetical protein
MDPVAYMLKTMQDQMAELDRQEAENRAFEQAQVQAAERAMAGGGGGGRGYAAPRRAAAPVRQAVPRVDPREAQENAERGKLRGDIHARVNDLNALYNQLFGNLDNVAAERARELEDNYGEQLGKAAQKYADGIATIDNSYAALGSGDSTDRTYAKNSAKSGFEETNKQIKKNKEEDLAKLGNYVEGTKAKWRADHESANRLNGRADEVKDLTELRGGRNSIEDKIGNVKADIGNMNTESGARGKLSELTGDGGRADSLSSALDSILKSSIGGGMKEAAVDTIGNAAGANKGQIDEIKKKNAAQFGDAYTAQQ